MRTTLLAILLSGCTELPTSFDEVGEPVLLPPPAASQSCDDAWCNDGQSSTIGSCTDQPDGSFTCSFVFDPAYDGQACSWGDHCCDDGQFHADCDTVVVDPAAACDDAWCSDGQSSTTDTCTGLDAAGAPVCVFVFDPSFEGQACSWGTYCCLDGRFHADCSDPTLPTTLSCPSGWCNDGDACTIDSCEQELATGATTCSNRFQPTCEGQACTWGAYCCDDGISREDCDGGGAASCPDPGSALPPTGSASDVTPTASTVAITNPSRGLYLFTHLVDSESYASQLGHGRTLLYGDVELDAFRTTAISEERLDELDRAFDKARDAGLRVIPRFNYTSSDESLPDAYDDASLTQILAHIAQLQPLFARHADVIMLVQAGFIGRWGEWHNSTHGLDADGPRRAVLEALLDALPASIPTQIRTPMYKEAIYGDPVASADVGTSYAGRIGHHNDCFLASDTDEGTYFPASEIDAWKTFVAEETALLPWGGESCGDNPPRSECPTALAELGQLHATFLNQGYHPDVLAGWTAGGCMDEVEQRLGYRVRMSAATLTSATVPAGEVAFEATFTNDGFGPVLHDHGMVVVLTHAVTGVRKEVDLGTNLQRLEGGASVSHSWSIRMPDEAEVGTWELGLWLPDGHASLRELTPYAIQLAHDGGWDDATGVHPIGSFEVEATAEVLSCGVTEPELL